MKKLLGILVVLMMVVGMVACGTTDVDDTESTSGDTEDTAVEATATVEEDATSEETDTENTQELHVGFAAPLTSGEYWSNLTGTTQEIFEDAGIKIDVISAETNIENQASIVSNFITMGVDAIIVSPIDPESISDTLKSARDAGITVIVDGSIPSDADCYDIALIAEQSDIGDALAQAAAAWIDKTYPDAEDGSIGVAIFGVYERQVDTDRCEAYKNVVNYTSKASLSVEYNIGWVDSQVKCQQNTELMLQQYPEVKCILTYGDYALFVDEVLQREGVDLTQYGCFANEKTESLFAGIKAHEDGESSVVGTSLAGIDAPEMYLQAVLGNIQLDENKMYKYDINVVTIDNISDFE